MWDEESGGHEWANGSFDMLSFDKPLQSEVSKKVGRNDQFSLQSHVFGLDNPNRL